MLAARFGSQLVQHGRRIGVEIGAERRGSAEIVVAAEKQRQRTRGADLIFDRSNQLPAHPLPLPIRRDDQRMKLPGVGIAGDRAHPAAYHIILHGGQPAPFRVGGELGNFLARLVQRLPGGRHMRQCRDQDYGGGFPLRGAEIGEWDDSDRCHVGALKISRKSTKL
ncbi:MAG TPA: hypothetical protein VGV07_19635 [Devosia sp.]|nr:hypothetical protein [Devosia sp.]HEV2517475.1 hypothetical protein [Devosia sp.]